MEIKGNSLIFADDLKITALAKYSSNFCSHLIIKKIDDLTFLSKMVKKEDLRKRGSFLKRIKSQLPVIISCFKLLIDLFRPFANMLIISYILALIQTGMNMLTSQFSGGIIDIVTRSKNVDDLKELAQKYSKKLNTSLKGGGVSETFGA